MRWHKIPSLASIRIPEKMQNQKRLRPKYSIFLFLSQQRRLSNSEIFSFGAGRIKQRLDWDFANLPEKTIYF